MKSLPETFLQSQDSGRWLDLRVCWGWGEMTRSPLANKAFSALQVPYTHTFLHVYRVVLLPVFPPVKSNIFDHA